jgi:hypothetical protein
MERTHRLKSLELQVLNPLTYIVRYQKTCVILKLLNETIWFKVSSN